MMGARSPAHWGAWEEMEHIQFELGCTTFGELAAVVGCGASSFTGWRNKNRVPKVFLHVAREALKKHKAKMRAQAAAPDLTDGPYAAGDGTQAAPYRPTALEHAAQRVEADALNRARLSPRPAKSYSRLVRVVGRDALGALERLVTALNGTSSVVGDD